MMHTSPRSTSDTLLFHHGQYVHSAYQKMETLEGKKTGSTSLIAELYDALPSSISHALLFHHGQHEHSASQNEKP
jgi:hypothetical protein